MNRLVEVFSYLRLPEEINSSDFGVDLTVDRPIDWSESSVYAGKGKVFKVYDGFMSQFINWGVLCKYQVLTNKVDELIRHEPQIVEEFGFDLKVIPIEKIGISYSRRNLCSVSQLIEGKNLSQENLAGEELAEMIGRFKRLNETLQRRLKEPAIELDFMNVKFGLDRQTMIVTDVCGVIASLNPDYHKQPQLFLG